MKVIVCSGVRLLSYIFLDLTPLFYTIAEVYMRLQTLDPFLFTVDEVPKFTCTAATLILNAVVVGCTGQVRLIWIQIFLDKLGSLLTLYMACRRLETRKPCIASC